MKKKLAIVGSGISGMIVAYYLKDDYDIMIFDKNDYPGGHTHTHNMEEDKKKFTLDTGFIVFNLHTYPNLLKLFAELGVEKQESDMSFSVYNQYIDLQYSGSGISYAFAQKKNIFSLRFWRMLLDIRKFYRSAIRDRETIADSEDTIEDYCRKNGLSKYFIDNFLVPMSSAVWSTPHEKMYDFPISLLLPFFFNHGLIGFDNEYQWYTVKGGSDSYTKKILEGGDLDLHLSEAVESVIEDGEKVSLKTVKKTYEFDYVLMASHSDESLKIVKGLSKEKHDLLSKYSYNKNVAVLHTDSSIMPPIKKVWSSWNHVMKKIGNRYKVSTIYWLNKLQKPDTKTDYFLSINPYQEIDDKRIIKTLHYDHPLFTTENFALQERLQELNENTRIFFAGAYFRYGFHEDGAKAGIEVVKRLKALKEDAGQ